MISRYLTWEQLQTAKITLFEIRHDAARDYSFAIIECDDTEYTRNFEPDANDKRILEDFRKDYRHWRVI